MDNRYALKALVRAADQQSSRAAAKLRKNFSLLKTSALLL
jgi:hypothetical protein